MATDRAEYKFIDIMGKLDETHPHYQSTLISRDTCSALVLDDSSPFLKFFKNPEYSFTSKVRKRHLDYLSDYSEKFYLENFWSPHIIVYDQTYSIRLLSLLLSVSDKRGNISFITSDISPFNEVFGRLLMIKDRTDRYLLSPQVNKDRSSPNIDIDSISLECVFCNRTEYDKDNEVCNECHVLKRLKKFIAVEIL